VRQPHADRLAVAWSGAAQHLPAGRQRRAVRRADTRRWILEFEPTSPSEIEPLMGWIASTDTQKHVRLVFPTRESAVAFAERHGWDYTVHAPRERTRRPKSYPEQFTRGITRAAA
jgi:hypothetical protein